MRKRLPGVQYARPIVVIYLDDIKDVFLLYM